MTMAYKKSMDELAARIRKVISGQEICSLNQADLNIIWRENDLSDVEKRLRLKNFSLYYGFNARPQDDLTSATFRNSD